MENRTFSSPTLGAQGAVGYGQDQVTAAPATSRAEARSGPLAPSRSLRARRRRPAVIAMAAALIAAGGLGGAVLYNSSGQRIAVLALARDVPYGQPLTADDLVVARIASDPALAPVSAADRNLAIGQRATGDLHRGALLLAADLTRALVVQPGMQEVGLPVHTSQLPADGLQVGQQIVIVQLADSNAGSTGGGGHGPVTMNAVVAELGKAGSDGSQVIDVAVPPSDATTLAVWAAGGRFQVILAPKAGAGAPSAGASPSAGSGAASPGSASGAPGSPSAPASGGSAA
ncbi:SAF domain-containing protein [Kitasatospora sp. NBC_01250]|uniref:SAF domain-containing protein n=1 Tax=unclassified Kitasatospora TaxID=2633591 RepID=UPI002E1596AF|nr:MULTISPECIES: SAF domain-containing protein [unclassified Kitasatospora]WSJ66143.1 SAF domain-containing protein [Kitasatospora sp. NBC_01302]